MKSLISRTFLSLINGVAFAVVFFLIVVWIESAIDFFVSKPVVNTNESLAFLLDGTAVVRKYTYNPYAEEFVTLDGERIEEEIEPLRFNTIHRQKTVGQYLFQQVPWSERIFGIGVSSYPPECWYWIHDGHADGSAYLVGFEYAENARIGVIGRQGFTQNPPEAENRFPCKLDHGWIASRLSGPSRYHGGEFPSAGYTETIGDPLFMVSDQSILAVNLKDRTIETVYRSEDQPPRSLYYFDREALRSNLKNREEIDEKNYPIVIFDTSASIVGLGQDSETLYEIPLPEEVLKWDDVQFGQTDSKEFIMSHTDHVKVEGERQRIETVYFRLDASGEIDERNTYEGYHEYPGGPPIKTEWVLVPALAAPGTFASFFGFVCYVEVAQGTVETYMEASKKNLKGLFRGMSAGNKLSLFLGFVVFPLTLAWLTHRRQIKFGRSDRERRFWTGFVLLFGMPGWIGYLTAHQWALLLPCPACKEESPVNLESCRSCGEAWPEPERKGTEVLRREDSVLALARTCSPCDEFLAELYSASSGTGSTTPQQIHGPECNSEPAP